MFESKWYSRVDWERWEGPFDSREEARGWAEEEAIANINKESYIEIGSSVPITFKGSYLERRSVVSMLQDLYSNVDLEADLIVPDVNLPEADDDLMEYISRALGNWFEAVKDEHDRWVRIEVDEEDWM